MKKLNKYKNVKYYFILQEMKLKPNSQVFESWRVPPLPMVFDIYLFNWTNPEDFTNHSTKPILQELGPYRFKEKKENVDITWNPENYTISYRRKSVYYFDAAGSVGSLNDSVTTLDMVAVVS
jgi:scavenger receptor class B, member 1